ncbi:hypothetical protein ACFL07_01995 [Pseudomonadota bacterium]
MKNLFLISLLFLLAACATPYYPVYISSDGAYYITEKETAGAGYGSQMILTDEIGTYPWWMGSYRSELFVYYSPNYYPHYFSIHNPAIFHPFYGFYRRHSVPWCPPHLLPRHDDPLYGGGRMNNPVPPSAVFVAGAPSNAQFRRANDLARVNRYNQGQRSTGRRNDSLSGSLPVTGRSSNVSSFSSSGGRSVTRSVSRSSAPKLARPYSNPSSHIHKP